MCDRSFCVLGLAAAGLLTACSPQKIQQPVTGALQVRSTSLVGGKIPDSYGCKGPGISPELAWDDPPPGTRSLAVVMDDQDATVGHLHRHYFVHWLAFDLKPERRELAENSNQSLTDDERLGTNDVGTSGYAGPCPGAGATHHYAITVYALDRKLGLPPSTDGRQLLTAIDGHILARGQLIGAYTK